MRQLEGSRTTGATGLHLLSAYLAGSQTGSFSRALPGVRSRSGQSDSVGSGPICLCVKLVRFPRPHVGFSE